MRKFTSYKDLVEEELRLKTEIELSKRKIEEYIETLINPVYFLEMFLGGSKKEVGNTGTQSEFELNLVELLLDFLYEKATTFLMANNDESKSSAILKLIAKSAVEHFYFKNKEAIVTTISTFVSSKIQEWKEK